MIAVANVTKILPLMTIIKSNNCLWVQDTRGHVTFQRDTRLHQKDFIPVLLQMPQQKLLTKVTNNFILFVFYLIYVVCIYYNTIILICTTEVMLFV